MAKLSQIVCKTCKGSGFVVVGGKKTKCSVCDGKGIAQKHWTKGATK
jgi:DnaJ-class molecular chaperone